MNENDQELLPVVNENDEQIDIRPRSEVHCRGLMHRAAHILVFNSKGELLIQQRAEGKDRYPGYWDVSVGGHLAPDESYELTAHRELKEELGIQAQIHYVTKIKANKQTGWEHIKLFECLYNGRIEPNPKEVNAWCFLTIAELQKRIRKGLIQVTPSLKVSLAHYLRAKRGSEVK